MATIEGFEAQIRPFKLALLEAFGLDPGKTSSNVSVDRESAMFRVVVHDQSELETFTNASFLFEAGQHVGVVFPAVAWTPEQRQAAENYIGQFASFGDFPAEIQAALRKQEGVQP